MRKKVTAGGVTWDALTAAGLVQPETSRAARLAERIDAVANESKKTTRTRLERPKK